MLLGMLFGVLPTAPATAETTVHETALEVS